MSRTDRVCRHTTAHGERFGRKIGENDEIFGPQKMPTTNCRNLGQVELHSNYEELIQERNGITSKEDEPKFKNQQEQGTSRPKHGKQERLCTLNG